VYLKKWQACKPGSVFSTSWRKTFIIYLVPSLLPGSLQPTPPDSRCASGNETGRFVEQQQLFNQDIFGFATREVYG